MRICKYLTETVSGSKINITVFKYFTYGIIIDNRL